ncbi:MAG: hypothetical protein AAFV53_22060 [Myxococcota bacterium]
MDSSQKDLKTLFENAQADLLNAQSELSSLIANAAADPWLETQQEGQRTVLTNKRDEMLQKWARIALSWLLRGGQLQLVPPDGQGPPQIINTPRPQPVTHAPNAAPAPRRPVVNRRPPVVQTIRRGAATRADSDFTSGRAAPTSTWRRGTVNDLDAEALRDLLDALTEPDDLNSDDDVRNELERLLNSTTPQALMDWSSFPKPVQRSLVGHIVARARHVQDELSPGSFPLDLSHDLDRIFSGMTAFSKREQPGFVFGLMRHHHPVGESWLSDARKWWQDLINQLPEDIRPDPEGALDELEQLLEEDPDDEEEIIDQALAVLEDGLDPEDERLVRLLAPHKHLLRHHTQFKKLRKAIRALETEE